MPEPNIPTLTFKLSPPSYEKLQALSQKYNRPVIDIVRLGLGLAEIALNARFNKQHVIITDKRHDPLHEVVIPDA